MKRLIIAAFCLLYFSWQAQADAVWAEREPRAWGAVLKYCVTCHDAGAIDAANLSLPLWEERIRQCMLYMASRGYPRPTEADRRALRDFLFEVTPADREPPVYLRPPERGGQAYP